MWAIVCLLFSLILTFLFRYVGSGYTNVVSQVPLCLLRFKLSFYLVRILYFVVFWAIIRLHQSNQACSTTCQTLLICKYQIPSIIPCCILENMTIFSHWSFWYMWDVIMKRKSTILSISTKPTTTYDLKITDHNKDQDI